MTCHLCKLLPVGSACEVSNGNCFHQLCLEHANEPGCLQVTLASVSPRSRPKDAVIFYPQASANLSRGNNRPVFPLRLNRSPGRTRTSNLWLTQLQCGRTLSPYWPSGSAMFSRQLAELWTRSKQPCRSCFALVRNAWHSIKMRPLSHVSQPFSGGQTMGKQLALLSHCWGGGLFWRLSASPRLRSG